MNEHVDNCDNDRELDRRLARDLAAWHADLDRAVDLDAGLADAALPGRILADTDELDQLLDLESGLTAILLSPHAPDTASDTATRRDPDTTPAVEVGMDTGEVAALLHFARDLASRPADERLRTRLWLPRRALSRIRTLVRVGPRTRKNLGALAFALARDLSHTPTLDHPGNPYRPRLGFRSRTRAIDLALALTRLGARDLACDLDRDLVHDLDRVVHSTRVLRLDHTRVSAFAHDLDLDRALDRALGRARTFAHDLAGTTQQPVLAAFVRAVAADRSATNLREEDLLEAVDIMERVVSDVAGADLRRADLTGIPLVGVRWSKTTLWPPAWRDQVRRESTQIGHDLWEIGHGGVDAEHLVTTR